ncbi:hypothetical protein HN827_01990 [archaeon]|jgi:hypothetical protein|nr:hypothetical protein [archaeon]MBT4646815.1 hypothetical protein [archaeon]MBT6821491.1 hypothetical protein [archaeon]MBT7391573.1 hypothetical protein [archaeon]
MNNQISQLKDRIFGKKENIRQENIEIYEKNILKNYISQDNTNSKKITNINNLNTGKFSLDEVLEILWKQQKEEILIVKDKTKEKFNINEPWLLLDQELSLNNSPKIILYEISDGKYFVYKKKNPEDFKKEIKPNYSPADLLLNGESSRINSMYLPTGITVETVPQHVLGDNVLGRAFIYQNRIQILNTLSGNDYHEVMTHEIFHIQNPEMNERNIRMMTKNYIGGNARYH